MSKEQSIDKAYEAYINYVESVGEFYMQDPAEQQAAEDVYLETLEEYDEYDEYADWLAKEEYDDGDTNWLAEEETDAIERLEYRYGQPEE